MSRQPTKPDVEAIVQKEEEALTRQSVADAWTEARRRRREVLVELEQAVNALEKRRDEADEMIRTLSDRLEAIADIDVDQEAPPSLSRVRRVRQDLHDAHVELTVFRRTQSDRGHAGGGGLADMSSADLSRLGIALFWPLVVGLLIAAGVLAAALRLALTL